MPSSTSTVLLLPDGSLYVTLTLSPGAWERIAAISASPLVITRSSTLVTTAPFGMPAFSAGPAAGDVDHRRAARRVLGRDLDADDRLRGLAGLHQFVGDAPGLVDGIAKPSPIDPPATAVAIAVLIADQLAFHVSPARHPSCPG